MSAPTATPAPSRARILVVEDEYLIALELTQILEDLDCIVVGPVGRIDAALLLAQGEQLDGALLDVNVAGSEVFPVAEALARRNVRFAFVSGYDQTRLPEAWRSRPVVPKPYQQNSIAGALEHFARA